MYHGIQAYANGRRNWIFRDAPPEVDIINPLAEWNPHGIIAHLCDAQTARVVSELGMPLVNVTDTFSSPELPYVEVDHITVGCLAAEHLLERGFVNFGYFGSGTTNFSKMREAGFRRRIEQSGQTVDSCHAEYLPRLSFHSSWRSVDQRAQRWLKQLPKPVGVLASNDIPARDLAEACRRLDLRVPDDVAILGVDNDSLQCRLSYPPLSSVALPAEQIGFEAAALLDRLMLGEDVPDRKVILQPLHVVVRQSTDTTAIDDAEVAAALTFIRRHATGNVGVNAVAEEAGVGRRVLERKFRELVGRTILDELRRVRVQCAKSLLCDTNLPIHSVAKESGFSGPQRLALVFRQLTGISPSEYRRRSRVDHRQTAK